MRSKRSLKERFEGKYRVTPGCWEWTAGRTGVGYGVLRSDVGRTMLGAHTVSYRLHVGPIPQGLVVRHKCDNRLCVNPDHLELGTHADNVRDRDLRGRFVDHWNMAV